MSPRGGDGPHVAACGTELFQMGVVRFFLHRRSSRFFVIIFSVCHILSHASAASPRGSADVDNVATLAALADEVGAALQHHQKVSNN